MELGHGPFGNFMKPTKLNKYGEELLNKAYEDGVMFWPYSEDDGMPPMTISMKSFEVSPTIEYKNAIAGIMKLGDHESTIYKSYSSTESPTSSKWFLIL